MSIIHFSDTQMAAGSSEGDLVYLGPWDFSGGGIWGSGAAVEMFGEGQVGKEGTFELNDTGQHIGDGPWLTNDGDGVGNWLFRTVDITSLEGSWPGQAVDYPGQWLGYRTDWQAFGFQTGIVEIGSAVAPDWSVGSSYGEPSERFTGFVQFSKYPRDTVNVTFDAADVSTGTDRITIMGHGFVAGDQAVYIIPDGESGIQGTGSQGDTNIVDNEFLSISIIDVNTIQLASNLSGADDTKSLFNLTSAGTGTGHILRKIIPATPTVGTEGIHNEINIDAST